MSTDRGPRIDLHSHVGRCFLAGLPAGHSVVAALGAASVADAVRAARAAGMTALALFAAGLGVLTAMTRPGIVLVPVSDFGLATLLLLEGIVAGAAAPLLFLAGLRRIGATQTAVLSLCEPLAAALLAAVMLRQLPAPTQLLGAALLVGAGIAVQVRPQIVQKRFFAR